MTAASTASDARAATTATAAATTTAFALVKLGKYVQLLSLVCLIHTFSKIINLLLAGALPYRRVR